MNRSSYPHSKTGLASLIFHPRHRNQDFLLRFLTIYHQERIFLIIKSIELQLGSSKLDKSLLRTRENFATPASFAAEIYYWPSIYWKTKIKKTKKESQGSLTVWMKFQCKKVQSCCCLHNTNKQFTMQTNYKQISRSTRMGYLDFTLRKWVVRFQKIFSELQTSLASRKINLDPFWILKVW